MLVGPHVNRNLVKGSRPEIVKHIEAAVAQAADQSGFKVEAVAIFVGGPHSREITLHASERESLRNYTRVKVVAHSSYTAPPWRGDPDAARYIREEQDVCQEAGIIGLVVHLPKLPRENVMKYITRIARPDSDIVTYLEIPAVVPSESYYETPAKLAKLFEAVWGVPGKFGLCIDTAHLNTCGVNLRSYEDASKWLEALERGARQTLFKEPGRILIHLNDSKRPLGKGPDAHAPLGEGTIWGGYKGRIAASGIAAFTDFAARHGCVVILERGEAAEYAGDYAIIARLDAATRAD